VVQSIYMIDVLPADAGASEVAASIRPVEAGVESLAVTDLGPARGDGIFETLGVIRGRPQGVDAHLARLANSARLLDLPTPNAAQWRAAIELAAAAMSASEQGGIRIVLTRGDGSTPTGWLVASPAGSDFPERVTGIRVVTLDRGYGSDVAARAPWLLAGAKTLSYAINMAAGREAARRGAADAIFLSSDGYVMEAPTSTVILREGDAFVTPRDDIGILPGTSQISLFEFFDGAGLETREELVEAARLTTASGLWLVSSVRLATPITHVDDVEIATDPDMTARMNAWLLSRDH
jgi:4-amino-4-deoxychorismate lyase